MKKLVDGSLWLVILGALILIAIVSCAMPPIEDVLPKEGVHCHAQITMPTDARAGETVDVKVRIYDCRSAGPAKKGFP